MENPHLIQSSTLPPAQPAYVLRGHAAQIHSVHFLRGNLRLLSGDANGWVVLWNAPVRRPSAVWRAHQDTILAVGSWGGDKIITHGRDSKLHIWHLTEQDEPMFSTTLPVDDETTERKQPWLLHSLTVNTMNFCSFAMCMPRTDDVKESNQYSSILIATPGVQDGSINITSLPHEARFTTIPAPKDVKSGMVMAIGLHYMNGRLAVAAGYESGHAIIWQQNSSTKYWETAYVNKSHSQPVLSLDCSAHLDCFFTSSVDAVIARHPWRRDVDTKYVQTKHAGQQGLVVRSDQKIFATAGWDGRARVYSTKTMKELAVLKWHKEGSYAIAFATTIEASEIEDGNETVADEAIVQRTVTVSQQRIRKSKITHWLACGSKDGKISLWDVY